MKRECSEQDPAFQALQQEFKDLIQNCSEEERAILMDRFDKLVDGYTRMEDLIQGREELCDQWSKYSDAHRNMHNKLKTLQARLAAPDIKEDEVMYWQLACICVLVFV
jgi:hypothetical protein